MTTPTPSFSPAVPSLFGNGGPAPRAGSAAPREARDLMDLLYDGFYMIFLLKNRYAPRSADEFRERVKAFLAEFERGAHRLHVSAEDNHLVKFAFCALVDEVVLMSALQIREAWARRPLQLELFGEQIAGERFFEYLERLRQEGAARVPVLEVFHMCLLLGFQGRYVLEGSEKLGYLTARLGDEIAQLRGRRAAFAPHWQAPDRIVNKLRAEVPLWVVGSAFALIALVGFLGLSSLLQRQTERDLQAYRDVIQMAPQAAHVTITLP
jgi:type VI secretion system protein ImpK